MISKLHAEGLSGFTGRMDKNNLMSERLKGLLSE